MEISNVNPFFCDCFVSIVDWICYFCWKQCHFRVFLFRSTFWSPSWDLLLCQPFLSQPIWLTPLFFFFFHLTAPVLGCQTPQSMTLLPSLQRNNSHCDKGFHNVALGDPHVQAGRLGLYFIWGQRSGFNVEQNKQEYDGNLGLFLFHVFIWGVYPSVAPTVLLHLFIVRKGI